MNFRIAASILSANFSFLKQEVDDVLHAGADMIHVDVMDNHYVPNLSFGNIVTQSLVKEGVTAPLDVHLMCTPVDSMIEQFSHAGISYITFHPEATHHVHRSLKLIQSFGIKSGVALNPSTPISVLEPIIDELDIICLMSVNPGFSAQSFIPSIYQKIEAVRALIEQTGKEILLEVDGGININNVAAVKNAGADTFVMGSALFNSPNYKETITAVHQRLR